MSRFTAATTVETSKGTLTFRHDPRVTITTNNSAAWVHCSCCDRSDYAVRFDDKKSHKSWCDLRGVYTFTTKPATTAAAAPDAAPMTAEELRAAGERAASTGLVSKNFRTEDDVVAAVRGGFLSESAAMNRDD